MVTIAMIVSGIYKVERTWRTWGGGGGRVGLGTNFHVYAVNICAVQKDNILLKPFLSLK